MAIYAISDTHFDHRNIIRYCHRPFRSVSQMNAALVNNWNRVVKKNDIVFFLGDLASGRYPLRWLKVLNGDIVLIQGNHDHTGEPFFILHHGAELLLLIHNPDHAPADWPGWVIHGHKHNNDLSNFPFINRERKTINVSADLIRYMPIGLAEIDKVIKGNGIPT